MEITLRYEKIQEEIFEFLKTWASGLIIAISFCDGMPVDGNLTKDVLSVKLVFDTLKDMSDRFTNHVKVTVTALRFTDVPSLLLGFKSMQLYNNATIDIETKATTSDNEFVQKITEVLAGLLAPGTVALWQQEAGKDVKRGMNAAIHAKLCPQLQAQAALDVSTACP